jgi:DNA-binding NarL/FixJ family response regulator
MRIVIAEDSALLRAGIERILIDAGHEVVASVADASNLLRLVNETHPDLAIVDVRMPPTFTDEGIRAAALLRSQNPESPVMVLSHYVEERYAADLIASDTRGWLPAQDRVADVPAFLDAVMVVAGGGTRSTPRLCPKSSRVASPRVLDQLTPANEVLQLMAKAGPTRQSPPPCTCRPVPPRNTSPPSQEAGLVAMTPKTAVSLLFCAPESQPKGLDILTTMPLEPRLLRG